MTPWSSVDGDVGERHVAGVGDRVAPDDRLASQDAEAVAARLRVNRHLVDGDRRIGAEVARVVGGGGGARVARGVGRRCRSRCRCWRSGPATAVPVASKIQVSARLRSSAVVGVADVVDAVRTETGIGTTLGRSRSRDVAERSGTAAVGDRVAPRDRLAGEDVEPVAGGRSVDRHLVDDDLRDRCRCSCEVSDAVVVRKWPAASLPTAVTVPMLE